jgi:hypothetical protein
LADEQAGAGIVYFEAGILVIQNSANAGGDLRKGFLQIPVGGNDPAHIQQSLQAIHFFAQLVASHP